MKNLTKKQLEETIKETRGIKTAICQMLGISDQRTLNGYIERWNLQEFLESQKQVTFDRVRHNITKWIDEGNEKVTLWYAERQMFDEFGNKQEVKHSGLKALEITVESPDQKKKIEDNL